MKNVVIVWKAFGGDACLEFNTGSDIPDPVICEDLFQATNVQSGKTWDSIKSFLPEARTHTSLSVGDEVIVDDKTYRCDNIGWSLVF